MTVSDERTGFCPGVNLLLARMNSHPEEFMEEYDHYGPSSASKWVGLVNAIAIRYDHVFRSKEIGSETCPGDMPVTSRAYSVQHLAYLTDAEVIALFNKVQEIRRDGFEQLVMRTLLADEEKYKVTEQPRMINVNLVGPDTSASDTTMVWEQA